MRSRRYPAKENEVKKEEPNKPRPTNRTADSGGGGNTNPPQPGQPPKKPGSR